MEKPFQKTAECRFVFGTTRIELQRKSNFRCGINDLGPEDNGLCFGELNLEPDQFFHFEIRYEEFQLAEALMEHDEYFSLWRSHHIKMVERMVGAKRGTGGSEGIGYLKTTLDKKFFPDLWEARTYLDMQHGSGGCPFAH